MDEIAIPDLRRAVESLHSCHATLVQSLPVRDKFRGKVAWEGVVHVFDIEGNPAATRAYAWSSPIEGSDRRRIAAVLHMGLIRSPIDAVRAAIVAEYRAAQSHGR